MQPRASVSPRIETVSGLVFSPLLGWCIIDAGQEEKISAALPGPHIGQNN
jgi:hypothetical protein